MPSRLPLEQTRPTGHGRARGLVSSRVSGRRVDARMYEPPPALRDVVETFWLGAWDLRGEPPHTTELLGDPCAHVVFERGPAGDTARFVGVWTRLWRRTLQDEGYVRGAKLRAGALRAFIDAPAHTFANRRTPLCELWPNPPTAAVLDPEDAEGFGALATWLGAHRRPPDPSVPLAVTLVQRIATNPEITTAGHLADLSGYSLRAVQRLFRDYVGASPKWVIRRNRLQEVALRIEKGDAPSLAQLAADLGYADQAHLSRDFKRVVGKTPRQFAASVDT